ncbi:BSD domain-containing protein [Rhynchospora pubera]|uniref:BSD domain-containing protein n=1 Tax=Rhynchospora pubera TaxID=906938 RepID=A0AAV8CKQ4_9POAL|nr:BSD domain-containing protein [Rhynchospora pubera]
MSWFARSLAASLNLPDSDQPADPVTSSGTPSPLNKEDLPEPVEPVTSTSTSRPAQTQGVREDLSELSQTFSRHFRGVASFLAPPPAPSDQDPSDVVEGLDSPLSGSTLRTGSGISRIASSFLQLRSDDEEEEVEEEEEEVGVSGYVGFDAIGITDEVLAFAMNISMHPETWLDFPLLPDEDEPDSLFSYFDMSEAQIEHAMALERLSPRLAALRIELCPIHMSEDTFWKIYFVLLHPRLSKRDADLLSTPQIVEARAMLMQTLQSKSKAEAERHSKEYFTTTIPDGIGFPVTDIDTENQSILSTEVQVVDKCVIREEPSWDQQTKNIVSDSQTIPLQSFDVEGDSDEDWFNKETELQENIATMHIGSAEDVSFSDLEDDDDDYCKK